MSQLQVTTYNNQRVLTTAQLAKSYGTDVQIITNNFNRNKNRYTEGKHYIALEGKEKRDFLDLRQNGLGSKNAAVLYLWTEKGAWLHAKFLGTDEAWEAYEMLVDEYYRIKDVPTLTPSQAIAVALQQTAEMMNKLRNLKRKLRRSNTSWIGR